MVCKWRDIFNSAPLSNSITKKFSKIHICCWYENHATEVKQTSSNFFFQTQLQNCTDSFKPCRTSNQVIYLASFFADVDGLGLDVPPGSPSSVRSSGDGSSCDTPPVNQCSSSTDDGRTDRGKYCDCCYCEFFGHAAVSNSYLIPSDGSHLLLYTCGGDFFPQQRAFSLVTPHMTIKLFPAKSL